MKTIGLDVSLDECKNEGYMMLEYDETQSFDSKKEYKLFAYYPEYMPEYKDVLMVNTMYSFEELKERYLIYKDGIDRFAETNIHVNFTNPSFFDALNLANDLNAYCGLD